MYARGAPSARSSKEVPGSEILPGKSSGREPAEKPPTGRPQRQADEPGGGKGNAEYAQRRYDVALPGCRDKPATGRDHGEESTKDDDGVTDALPVDGDAGHDADTAKLPVNASKNVVGNENEHPQGNRKRQVDAQYPNGTRLHTTRIRMPRVMARFHSGAPTRRGSVLAANKKHSLTTGRRL